MSEEEQGDGEINVGRWWRRLAHNLAGGPRSRRDLLEVLKEARESEILDADALAMFQGVLETDELQVRDIMVPRSQMVVLEREWGLDRLLGVVVESGHSRFPVIGDSRDEVVGILLAKDLLKLWTVPHGGADTFDLRRMLRPASFVPESKRVNVLLKDFKRARNHMAIVVDEYGGVSGLVTIEDVLEQIVGEIDDEYDDAEASHIQQQDERRYLVHALTPVEEFNEHFGTDFPTEEYDTIGGLVMHELGHMPKRGESVRIAGFNFNVQRADSRRIQLLQVTLAND